VNATERIRAALQKTETARHTTDAPSPSNPADVPAPALEPVESTLRLVSTNDAERVAAPRKPPTAHRGPAATVELLRSTLTTPPETKPAAPPPAPAAAANPAPTPAPAPVAIVAPTAEETDAATELRLWASEVPSQKKRPAWIWMVAVGVLVVAGIAAFIFRGSLWPGRSGPAPVTTLQLAVESSDNGLISLRWNPHSLPVTEAREGHLTITEDQQTPRVVALTAPQLTAGHLFYESSAGRVDFQLEVVRKTGEVSRESVLAARKPAPTGQTPAQPTETAQVQTPVPTPAEQAAAEPPQAAKPQPKAFTPPPTPQHQDPGEGRIILMEPVPSIAGAPAVPNATILPERANILPPPQPAAAPPKPPASRIQVGGKLQSAMLLRKVEPTYPQLARQMRVQGVVRFQAVISKEGEVKDLKFVSGPRVLEQAAADAIKRWVYRPTLLDGRPVEVSTQIDLNFTLGQ